MTHREFSIDCPFCASGIAPGHWAMLRHALHCHKVGIVAWALIAVWLLGMFWAILAGSNPPPTLP